ncbi:site-specific integrase [Azospirillum sp. YIM DDC1]|uniref:Site-specific integrase n=1 Tax=Azospirillum aestuarii TaxID=2802052 RepID=A0ABS1I8K8_9PROT|nr:site-specific integrase [Azospirillum aestuarii]MBK4723404.1 site-specific integrase [Azospirillum aestuarii]
MDTLTVGAVPAPGAARKESLAVAMPTIADLKAEQERRVKATSASSWPNYKTALAKFMQATGLSDSSPLVPGMTLAFKDNLRVLIEENPLNLASATLLGMKSRLVDWHQTAVQMAAVAAATESGSFSAYLKALIAKTGKSQNEVARQANIPLGTFGRWCTGWAVPSPYGLKGQAHKTMPQLKRLDAVFGLPEGTVLSQLHRWEVVEVASSRRAMPTAAVADARNLTAVPLRLQELPPGIEDVMERHLRFKTERFPGYTGDGKPMRRSKKAKWRMIGDECATADLFRDVVTTFFGWLTLPSSKAAAADYIRRHTRYPLTPEEVAELVPSYTGKGYAPDQLDFCQITEPPLVSEFLEWRTKRTGGESGQSALVMGHIRALIRPDYGFLWQYPEAAWKHMGWEPVDGRQPSQSAIYQERMKEWQAVCAERHTVLGDMAAEVGNSRKSRDPKVLLRPIVDHPDPLSILSSIIRRHELDRPIANEGTKMKAMWFRDQLLLRMMVSNPLRNRNYREMTWRPDNTGNLYKRSGGSWRLRFAPENFKNERGAAKSAYDVEILPELWARIEEYVEVHRPALLGDRRIDNVFVTIKGTAFTEWTLSDAIYRATHRYQTVIPEAAGFRSHAIRHIAATAWLKANPGDYLTVALILHDKLETVMENYAHLKAGDGLARYGSWIGGKLGG